MACHGNVLMSGVWDHDDDDNDNEDEDDDDDYDEDVEDGDGDDDDDEDEGDDDGDDDDDDDDDDDGDDADGDDDGGDGGVNLFFRWKVLFICGVCSGVIWNESPKNRIVKPLTSSLNKNKTVQPRAERLKQWVGSGSSSKSIIS